MSTAYQLYTALVPHALRKHLDPLQQSYHEWKKKASKRRLSSASAHRARCKKLHAIMAKRPLKVAFQVAQLSKWKCESVLQLMLKDDRFEPFVWCVPVAGNLHITNPEEHARETKRICEHFDKRGVRLCTYISLRDFPTEEKPDLIFIHEAYDYIFLEDSFRGMEQELLCYVPYCFHNTVSALGYDGIGNNCSLFVFWENESVTEEHRRGSTNKGRNGLSSGNPIADIFLDPAMREIPAWKDCGRAMKRVIWAPHWTITADSSWFLSGTFLKTEQAMMELVQEHRDDIQFAFKPHPHLYRMLCEHPEWGKEKTDAFYRQWEEMPNTQLAEGDYTALIMQSDAMIHDSGSFILEYLFADKPAMFLRDGAGYGGYNQMTLDALTAYHIGLSKAEIADFLQRCVLQGEDSLADTREHMRKEYLLPPNGKTAAENIVEAILNAAR